MSVESWAKTQVIRFSDLKPLPSSPADVALERYQRQRLSVIGRVDERRAGDPGTGVTANLNFGYIRCAPNRGNSSHSHPNWEIFMPMSGRWRLVLEGGELDAPCELMLEQWDVIVIPPDTFHEATNVSDAEACLLSLNPGRKGAGYTVHPSVIEALRAVAPAAANAAALGQDIPWQPS
jgi:hypothetical protein